MIEYLIWSPDKTTFIDTMLDQRLPGDISICRLPTENEYLSDGSSLIWIDGITCHEIGEIQKQDGEIVSGYHVNILAYGWLADFLNLNGGWSGILPLLGHMEWQLSEVGEPAGYVGTSGVKIYPASSVNKRAVRWA